MSYFPAFVGCTTALLIAFVSMLYVRRRRRLAEQNRPDFFGLWEIRVTFDKGKSWHRKVLRGRRAEVDEAVIDFAGTMAMEQDRVLIADWTVKLMDEAPEAQR